MKKETKLHDLRSHYLLSGFADDYKIMSGLGPEFL